MLANVTLYKVKILYGNAPNGRWVTFTDRSQRDRYFSRCSEGSAKKFNVYPIARP